MVLAVLLLGCNTKTQGTITEENNTESALSGTITIDGSSTVYPISAAVAETFIKLNPNVNVTVSFSGTGGGFKKFYSGDIEISDASRPIKSKEQNQCKAAEVEFIELPVAYDGIGVYVNPQNSWCSSLTVGELHKIWKPGSRITNWNQIRSDFPDVSLQLYGPGADSGTFDYFTEAINGKSTACRPDYTKSEDDNVLVNGISGNVGALGYFGLAYYEANKDKLKLIGIDDENDSNGKGAIKPNLETVANGTYQPLARPIFIYICHQ